MWHSKPTKLIPNIITIHNVVSFKFFPHLNECKYHPPHYSPTSSRPLHTHPLNLSPISSYQKVHTSIYSHITIYEDPQAFPYQHHSLYLFHNENYERVE